MLKENILIVNGIRIENWQKYHEEFMQSRKENNGYDESSRIFELHEQTYGLDGYWIGDIDNPEGLIIGCIIASYGNYSEINLDELQQEFNHYSDVNFKEYEGWANEFLGTEDKEFKLHIFIEKFKENDSEV